MIELKGKYGNAFVFNDSVEEEAISQIINLLDQPMAEGAHVRIMPDVHAGTGCVIGYTAKMTGPIVPNLIGVDIGCGVIAFSLGKRGETKAKFDKLDKFIRKKIPFGRDVREDIFESLELILNTLNIDLSFDKFKEKVNNICDRTNQDKERVWAAIGSLGGGNHFIEIDNDDEDLLWLVIHTGSRNFGLQIANHHQHIASDTMDTKTRAEFQEKVEEIKKTKKGKGIEIAINKLRKQLAPKKVSGLEFLEGKEAEFYFHDMNIAQIYAQLNRRVIAQEILSHIYKKDFMELSYIESIHNYINFNDRVIRKGAISAHKGEKVIIPLNMADGSILGIGKGNEEWNNSAPHGAGRKMSRNKAKANIQLSDFQKIMKQRKIWSTCISKYTLDESPQAYKKARDIIRFLAPTVEIISHMKPLYNFKAPE